MIILAEVSCSGCLAYLGELTELRVISACARVETKCDAQEEGIDPQYHEIPTL